MGHTGCVKMALQNGRADLRRPCKHREGCGHRLGGLSVRRVSMAYALAIGGPHRVGRPH